VHNNTIVKLVCHHIIMIIILHSHVQSTVNSDDNSDIVVGILLKQVLVIGYFVYIKYKLVLNNNY